MSLSGNIPLVQLGVIIFFAGVLWNELRRLRIDIKAVEQAMKESAKAQGERIGECEDAIGTLRDWRMTELGRRRERADTKGIPISIEE